MNSISFLLVTLLASLSMASATWDRLPRLPNLRGQSSRPALRGRVLKKGDNRPNGLFNGNGGQQGRNDAGE